MSYGGSLDSFVQQPRLQMDIGASSGSAEANRTTWNGAGAEFEGDKTEREKRRLQKNGKAEARAKARLLGPIPPRTGTPVIPWTSSFARNGTVIFKYISLSVRYTTSVNL